MTKGLAIILMVISHAPFLKIGWQFISMFHMPLFFIVSGYCFKENYLNDSRIYLRKRIKGAYWPYVKYQLLFLLLHNVFFTLNIYNGEYGFNGQVSELYSLTDYFKHAALIVFTMSGGEQLLGGYWFLHSYFIAALISFFVIRLFRYRLDYLYVGGGILLLVSFVMLFLKIRIPYIVEAKEILASSLMVFGFVYKKTLWHLEDKPIFIIPICGLIVALGTELWPCDMLSLSWQKVIPYFFSGLSGTLMIFSLCKLLCKFSRVVNALVYIGDRTIDVLTWHLLSFKIVSIVIIVIYKLPIARLAEFPVIREYNYQGWWLLYTIIGVMVSLLLGKLFARVSVICSRSGRISSANH